MQEFYHITYRKKAEADKARGRSDWNGGITNMNEEKKTAEWISVGFGEEERFQCSGCGMVWFLYEGNPIENEMYYCPRCGRKMGEQIVRSEEQS